MPSDVVEAISSRTEKRRADHGRTAVSLGYLESLLLVEPSLSVAVCEAGCGLSHNYRRSQSYDTVPFLRQVLVVLVKHTDPNIRI